LDIFEAEVDEACGSNSHPEDVYISPQPLRRIERFDQPHHSGKLAQHVSKSAIVLDNYSDRIYHRKFQGAPIPNSIELVKPDDLWWWIRDEGGKRKHRALFRVGNASRIRYDFAVTDPVWLQQLNLLSPGIYSNSRLLGEKPHKTLLTVSLSEPFEGFHYKLVAAVLSLPQ
jgi:hypothetical protein